MVSRSNYCGVGVFDGDYTPQKFEDLPRINGKRRQKLIWTCPYYVAWKEMIRRCYSCKYHIKRPTYIGCSVVDEWHLFSNFKSWMQAQDWEGKQLDKDLLFPDNKIYGPTTCIFLTPKVNSFITDLSSTSGEWPTGVSLVGRVSKFRAYCRNPFTGKQEHLGYFKEPCHAHQAWLTRKLELAKQLAGEQTDGRVSKALVERYENYKENFYDTP